MAKYNCIIADDSFLERDALQMFLEMTDCVNIVAVCGNGIEARQALKTNEVDIIFSDIDMPDISGLDLIRSLSKKPAVVFITSYPEYAATGFELDAIDFIVKPVTFERVARSVNKVIEYIEMKKLSEQQTENVVVNINQNKTEDYIFIRETPDLVKIKFDEVAYIESMGEFSKIYTLFDKQHITLVSLKNLELQLPETIFMRIHKQYIVNLKNISAIGASEVTLNDTFKIPISLTHKQALIDKAVNTNILNRYTGRNP
ncbi:MAG: response regulator transcription factor [Bacteroidia bacterium]|nr:response regulator transcription factor [Bacteroidia bacterium]